MSENMFQALDEWQTLWPELCWTFLLKLCSAIYLWLISRNSKAVTLEEKHFKSIMKVGLT